MHEDEVETDAALVRRLLETQFPQWAGLPIALVVSYGTDHDIYRLGDGLSVRLPRIGWATGQAAKEATWLPRLAAHLPLGIPVQVAAGRPAEGYPLEWSVYEWLPGEDANGTIGDLEQAAVDLAAFVRALRGIDTSAAHPRRPRARGAPWWHGDELWVHGDLLPGNLLVVDGRLAGVIDWGALDVGDPACDLQPAWNMFEGASRARFRAELEVDDASWLRGRGWALYQAVLALPYYWSTNPGMVRQASHALWQVLADDGA